MTDEEINRKFDVVASHMASFAVGMQRLEEAQARGEARLDRVERVLGTAIRIGSRRLNSLIDAQERTTESIARLSEAQARTDAKLAETGERLNILVNTVERYISERRGGTTEGNGGS